MLGYPETESKKHKEEQKQSEVGKAAIVTQCGSKI